MTVGIREQIGENIIEIDLRGKLSKEDYRSFVPEIEEQIRRYGKVRVLVQMNDFHGWTPGGLWEDIKFDVKHFNHLERIAFVGNTRWEAAMTTFCKAFTSATIRFFEPEQVEAGRVWLHSP
jgi:hypothetical protein